MNDYAKFILVTIIIALVDLPWLTLISDSYLSAVKVMQGGRAAQMRPLFGIVVYIALAYLLLRAKSVKEAFHFGLATYAVYDFTVLAIFRDYPLQLALADSLWGGVLLAVSYYIKEKVGL